MSSDGKASPCAAVASPGDPVPMATLAERPPPKAATVTLTAGGLLVAYAFTVLVAGCLDVGIGSKGISEINQQHPQALQAINREATGFLVIAFVLSALKFPSAAALAASGFLVMLQWRISRLAAFAAIAFDVYIGLLGRLYAVAIIIPAGHRIQMEQAQQQGPLAMMVAPQGADNMMAIQLMSQAIGVFIFAGIWAVLCIPAVALLLTKPADIAFGNKRFWQINDRS